MKQVAFVVRLQLAPKQEITSVAFDMKVLRSWWTLTSNFMIIFKLIR